MPDFEHDIFISYSHDDNEPGGWIAQLHQGIESWVLKLTGKKPKVWRDQKMDGIDFFDERIEENLIKAALLVAVMSPPYMNSEWCQKELNQFLATAREQGRLRIGNKARVVKVIKNPIPREAHPLELQNVLGYEFFRVIDSASGKTRELNRVFGPEDEHLYNAKLYDLVFDLGKLLELIHTRGDGAPATPPPPPSGITVYLAETTPEMDAKRDQIRRELQQHGHKMLPDQNLPWSYTALKNRVCEDLERCDFSIHLVGEVYGRVPLGAERKRSVVELQIALAAVRSRKADFPRVIWMPENLEVRDENQRIFVERLENHPAGADLLKTRLEDLKTFIQDKIGKLSPDTDDPSEATSEDRPSYLYLLCNPSDLNDIEPLYSYFRDQRFDIKWPLFKGNKEAMAQHHQKMLDECDAILIYYGDTDNAWVDDRLLELRRLPAGKATTVYVTLPEDPLKSFFGSQDVDTVIVNFDDFTEETMVPFLRSIEAKRGGQP